MMKKYISIIFITLAIAGSSCKKDYLNLATNPNTPSTATPQLLLSAALKTTAGIVNGGGYVMYCAWDGFVSQSTGFQPFVSLEEYQFTTSTYDVWTPNYINISNYTALAKSTAEPNYQAITKIMIAFDFEALVDNYNNVPFTSAIQGTSNLNPTYQKGSDIYDALMKQLDAAIVQIQGAPATAANPAGSDIMFQGKMVNWIKFANTLKLRLALRESTTQAGNYATNKAAAAATQSLGYLDNTVAAVLNPGYLSSDANGGQQSPIYLNYGFTATGTTQTDNNEYQANTYTANYLGSNNDPRLIRIYAPTATAAAASKPALLPGAAINTQLSPADGKTVLAIVSTTFGDSQPPTTVAGVGITPSKPGPGVIASPTMNATILSGSEALFLQAEAANIGIITGNAQTLYQAGITQSFAELNAQTAVAGSTTPMTTAASAAALYAPGAVYAWPATAAAQEQAIITQKWVALNLAGAFEAFNEMRRTGYPAVPTSTYPGANAPNQVARIFYPFIEYATNATNVAAQGTIDKFSSKIFWAK